MAIHTQITGPSCTAVASTSWIKSTRLRLAAWRQRRALRRLDDAALKDIGITRAQAIAEADLIFWDVPANWRK